MGGFKVKMTGFSVGLNVGSDGEDVSRTTSLKLKLNLAPSTVFGT